VVARPEQKKPISATAGERRHVTVLFCDLVGSTEIAARLDPEEWREVVGGYHRAAAESITRFGGHVAHYFGDGVMAYFGWPEAHDNNAERAALAGLAILDALSKLNELSARPKLSARVGIDSGAVVIGASAGKSVDVFGETPNIAARVQGVTLPGTVLITADTHRLISGMFVVEDCGTRTLKGIERPIQLYRVIQPSGMRGRLEAVAAARGLTPFVGREDELRLLINRWERTQEGVCQAVLIIGEAGIGKSRLVRHFHQQITGTPHTWADASATPLFQNTPFYPVTELLRQFLAAPIDEPLDHQLARLESAVELAGMKPAEAIPLIAPLLNLPVPQRYPAPLLLPGQQRRRLLATLIEWVRGLASLQPLVITVEDLQWADPSTLELLEHLLEQEATARLLLLYTGRPEFRPQWPLRAHHTQVTLNRLSACNVRTMVGQVAAHKALSEDTVGAIVERTGGVPLFVEELTRVLLESCNERLSKHEIPVTLHDSLTARMDRLGSAKEILQIGAVIGSEFSYELLQAICPGGDEALQHALQVLADAELLYVRGIAPDATYQFKHALIRDAAYEALLKSRRKDLHRLITQAISEKFPALKETQPEVFARHCAEAGEIELAIEQWSTAGKTAEARYAFIEARESLQQALALLNLLPESHERDARELKIRQSLVAMLQLTRGVAAPETLETGARIGLLVEKSGDILRLVGSTLASSLNALLTGELSRAAALADAGLDLALRDGNETLMASVHALQLLVRFYLGDLAAAENHFALGLKFFDDPAFRQDPRDGAMVAFAHASFNAWTLGRADVARERLAKMRGTVNPVNPHDLPRSNELEAWLHSS
jgi:class 3 adenylate cyclase